MPNPSDRIPVLDQPTRKRTKVQKLETPISLDLLDVHCQYCPGQMFRRSRLRSTDLKQMAMMRYPVRCLRCSQRQFVSFTVAGLAVSSSVKHSRKHRPVGEWANWTPAELNHLALRGEGPEGAGGARDSDGSDLVHEDGLRPPAAPPPSAEHPEQGSAAKRKQDPDGNEIW